MAKDLGSTVRGAVTNVARDAIKNLGDAKPAAKSSNGRLSGAKGLAAGAGLAAMVPLAKKGVGAIRSGAVPTSPAKVVNKAASSAGDRVGAQLKETVSSKIDKAGGAGGLAKEAASGLLPGGGGNGGGGSKGGMPGVGKGRRMPVQQAVDVAVPIETAYNQWTQFEDWPEFMHRVTRVTQEDECTVSFASKIWGKTKEFTAQIETQRPDERIKWRVSQGITHTGVVTFHELGPRLTRIEVSLDVDPGSLIEKAARGMRHVKRAVRADLHRYKAFIEMQELETGAWRGVIEEGELVEPHDDDYDEERDYSDLEDIRAEAADDEDSDDEQEDEDRDGQRERTERFKRQAEGSRERRTAAAERSSSSRAAGGRNGTSNGKSRSAKRGGTSAKPKATSRS
jgi:uncharacterized membrane protein